MKKISLLFIVCFLLNACSLSNSSKEAVTSKPSDELEFTVDTISESPPAEIKVEEEKIAEIKIPDEVLPTTEGKEQAMIAPEEPKFQDYQKEMAPTITPIAVTESTTPMIGKEAQYHVQKGDTLMMIAFKIYGDYRKWKDLKEWNKDKLKSKIGPGVVLKYLEPEHSFSWQPVGLPYLVKMGDTLQLVSKDKYGTPKKWRSIYENNRQLILDPNLIFAGFTIYYVPTRDIASKRK